MVDYPILFRITHVVRCAMFEALVVADGRVVMAYEDDAWWCHGVEPGGLSENGEGPLVAFQRFRRAFQEALDDLAESCREFEDFSRDAGMLFATDTTEAARWTSSLANVREGIALDEPFRGMPRLKPRPSNMSVDLLADFADTPMAAAASEETALPLAA